MSVRHKGDTRILTIPDTHFPFVDKPRLEKMLSCVSEIKPTHIVQIGDLMDYYNFSRFPKSNDVEMPKREVEKGREMAEKMWADLRRLAPNAKKYQSWGNHEDRPFKRILERAPELEEIISKPLIDLLTFPGVTTMGSSLDELDINGIYFIHGWSTQPGFHMNYFGRSVVHGHTHHGDVKYLRRDGKTLFELDCGILANYNARPMIYRSTLTTKWTPGFGLVDRFGPRFIPL